MELILLGWKAYSHILGTNFECESDYPSQEAVCPVRENGPEVGPDNSWMCPLCYYHFGYAADGSDATGDLEDDEEDSFDYVIDFVGEGEMNQDNTDKQNRILSRYNALRDLADLTYGSHQAFSLAALEVQDMAVSKLMELEAMNHPDFKPKANHKSKLIAIVAHLTGIVPNKGAFEAAGTGIKMNTFRRKMRALEVLLTPGKVDAVALTLETIGDAMGLPKSVTASAVDKWEKEAPLNREPDMRAVMAAYLWLEGKKAGSKVTQKAAYTAAEVTRGSFVNARNSFIEQRQKVNRGDEK